jgi:phosphoglycolate phosphatase-like HAD superfamily hydrolase
MTVVVAFDWNGTLLDDCERAVDALAAVMERRGLAPLDETAFREVFQLPMKSLFSQLGIADDDLDTADREWNIELQHRRPRFATGALEAVRELRSAGVSVGVVTAASQQTVEHDLGCTAGDALFDFVIAPAHDKAASLRAFVTDSSSLFYVGDTEYDMRAALHAGAIPIGYGSGYRPAARLVEAGARDVIVDFASLTGVIDSRR